MKYRSTQGALSDVSFEESLYMGWLSDGSLLVPEYVPKLSEKEILNLSKMSYKEIIKYLFKLFVDEDFITHETLAGLLEDAYREFPEEITPIKKLYGDAYVLELFHGPTHSFKDVPLAVVGPMLNLTLKKNQKRGIVYVCTSGDTGSAVISVTKDLPNIDTVVMFPGGERISELQRLLITTGSSKNIHNFVGDCYCDDFDVFLQSFVTQIKEEFPELVVTSLNSLLWMRIMMQTGHLLYSYFQVSNGLEAVDIVIPTGGAGHLTSAVIVQKLGVSINIKAVFNERNQNLYNFLNGGELKYNPTVTQSSTPAMDIQTPCNLERIIYFLTDGDVKQVKAYMQEFLTNKTTKASPDLYQKIVKSLTPLVVTENEIFETMKRCWEEKNYILDPHTAVGLATHYKKSDGDKTPSIYCGTASPMKFTAELKSADIPVPQHYNDYLDDLKTKKEHVITLPQNDKEWDRFMMDYIRNRIV